MARIFIAIGSNIDPQAHLRECAALLREAWPEIRFSAVYTSAPQYEEDQAEFLNAAATFESNDEPADIQAVLQSIEKSLQKNIPYPNGPRTIDLDLLLYDDLHLETENLQVPHPRMHTRKFVLAPLCDLIDAQAKHPLLQETWESLLQRTSDQDCERTDLAL